MLPCLNKKYLGMECLGCGLQRSAAFLLRGEFAEAFRIYPAIYPLTLLLLALAWNHFRPSRGANRLMVALLILSLGSMVIQYLIKISF